MRSIIIACFLSFLFTQAHGQDLSGIGSALFNQLLNSVVSQWGNMSSEDMAGFIDKLTAPGGLHHVWNGLGNHCNSHFDCGPEACCLQPTVNGKRAFTDGVGLQMTSYCSPLKKAGQTCSLHHSGDRTSTFSCPCEGELACASGGSFQIHPLITIHKDPTCEVKKS